MKGWLTSTKICTNSADALIVKVNKPNTFASYSSSSPAIPSPVSTIFFSPATINSWSATTLNRISAHISSGCLPKTTDIKKGYLPHNRFFCFFDHHDSYPSSLPIFSFLLLALKSPSQLLWISNSSLWFRRYQREEKHPPMIPSPSWVAFCPKQSFPSWARSPS